MHGLGNDSPYPLTCLLHESEGHLHTCRTPKFDADGLTATLHEACGGDREFRVAIDQNRCHKCQIEQISEQPVFADEYHYFRVARHPPTIGDLHTVSYTHLTLPTKA